MVSIKKRRWDMTHKVVVVVLTIATLVVAVSVRNANAHPSCALSGSDYTDYGLEALCLYAQDSALAGHWPTNPIASRQVIDYTKYHSEQGGDRDGAALAIDTGEIGKYFDPRIARIHYCYAHQKKNLCDVYRTH